MVRGNGSISRYRCEKDLFVALHQVLTAFGTRYSFIHYIQYKNWNQVKHAVPLTLLPIKCSGFPGGGGGGGGGGNADAAPVVEEKKEEEEEEEEIDMGGGMDMFGGGMWPSSIVTQRETVVI